MIDLVSLVQATTTTTASSGSSSGGILGPIAKPLAEVLAAIYSVIPNYGVAIVGLGVAWMLLISPLTLKSTRSMLAMQKLQPQLKKLQEQHKGDRQAFAQAQMELFREHKVSPFGSCLPMLLPMPVFFALFEVIDGLSHTSKVVVNGVSTVVATPRFLNSGTKMYKAIQHAGGHIDAFGMNLAKGALTHHSSVLSASPYWILLLALAATSYVQSAMMMSRNQTSQANPQMKMMKYLAPLFALISVRFPAGVVLYYTVSNVARIVQQDLMYRFDPKVKALVVREVQEVEDITRTIDEQDAKKASYTPPKALRSTQESGSPAVQPKRTRFRDLLAAAAEQQANNKGQTNKAKTAPTSNAASKRQGGQRHAKTQQKPSNNGAPRAAAKPSSEAEKTKPRPARPSTGASSSTSPSANNGSKPVKNGQASRQGRPPKDSTARPPGERAKTTKTPAAQTGPKLKASPPPAQPSEESPTAPAPRKEQ